MTSRSSSSSCCPGVPLSPIPLTNHLNAAWLQAAAREAERLRQERAAQRKEYEGQQVRAEGCGWHRL